jgi:hypothetical protein
VLAHAGTPNETLATILLGAGFWLGLGAVNRFRHKAFPRVPTWGAALMGVGSAGLIVAGLVTPVLLRPRPAAIRPASTATLEIANPTDGQVVPGELLRVRLSLQGGRIVDTASTTLTTNTGHIHVSIDGHLVSMTYGLTQVVEVGQLSDGPHTLTAEFVAADHGPFVPRVIASVTFTKGGPG